jgi:hypothetical protein
MNISLLRETNEMNDIPTIKIVGYVIKGHNEYVRNGKIVGFSKLGPVIECSGCKTCLIPDAEFKGKCDCGHYWKHQKGNNFFEYN